MSKCINCDSPTTGKSKYCREHAALARAAWREMIADKGAERVARQANFAGLLTRAHEAGMVAGNAAVCEPMGVAQVMPDGSRRLVDVVPDGPCGFAWVTLRPGNCGLALFARKRGEMDKAYGGGVQRWVGEFNQSMTRKEAYARAYAEVLRAEGYTAYSGSRMD